MQRCSQPTAHVDSRPELSYGENKSNLVCKRLGLVYHENISH
jgi:hypothetical protein